MNMNVDDFEVEQALESLGRDWPAGDSVVDRVMQGIETESVDVARRSIASWVIGPFAALAASVAVVAGLWWILSGGNTLYAQVVDAIKRTRTLHMTATVQPDKKKPPQQVMESWYERGEGFRETVGPTVRLGNQKNFWTYLPDSKSAIRSESHGIDDVVNRMLDNEMIKALRDAKIERDANGDEVEGGRPCRSYVLSNFASAVEPALQSGKKRLRILLDDQSRIVRAFLEDRTDNRWVVQVTYNWKYDVPVDRALFEPRFAEDVKIVDSDAVFDKFFDPQNAVHREERSGLVYAIHHVERFQNGGILVVSSVRGTADTLKKYPLTRRPLGPGRIFVDGPAANYEASPQGDGFFRIDLASADHDGIDVRWWVLVPRGTPPTFFEIAPGKVKLPVGITPHGEFAKANFADEHGTINHLEWNIVLDLPRTDHLPTLDAIANHLYADLAALELMPFKWLDMGVKDNSRQVIDPIKTTAAAFRDAVVAHIRWWYDRDVEFQLEGQFEPRLAQHHDDPENWPAIGLSYEPTVDDATLARIAKHKSLKRLYLDGTPITDDGLKHLTGLKELRTLGLAQTQITDAGLKQLEGLSALRKINVQGTKVTKAGIARLQAKIPQLHIEM